MMVVDYWWSMKGHPAPFRPIVAGVYSYIRDTNPLCVHFNTFVIVHLYVCFIETEFPTKACNLLSHISTTHKIRTNTGRNTQHRQPKLEVSVLSYYIIPPPLKLA